MSAPRGDCPSLLAPTLSGDGLLVRVKPRAATLTADQAARVAAGAGRYGNGIVELTNRGHLQLRGLADAGVEGFAGEMARIGLAAAEPGAEAVRNVLADPLGPDDPRAAFDSHRLAHRLSAMLEGDPALHALPHKFGLLVDAGTALPLAGWRADIMLRAAGTGIAISLDGGDRALVRAAGGRGGGRGAPAARRVPVVDGGTQTRRRRACGRWWRRAAQARCSTPPD